MPPGSRTWTEWVAAYSTSHQNHGNQLCHLFGIPLIVLSLLLALAAIVWHGLAWAALILFVGGWSLQFLGHAIEGKPPEFFRDWRFLLVGTRWWAAKVLGRKA